MIRDNEGDSWFFEDVMTARNAREYESFLPQECSNVLERCSYWIIGEAIEQFTFFHSQVR
jgi:hypothetical protein